MTLLWMAAIAATVTMNSSVDGGSAHDISTEASATTTPMQKLGTILLTLFAIWFVGGTLAASIVAALQERKVWAPRTLDNLSLWGMFKVALFNTLWCMLCFVGAIGVMIKYIITLGRSNVSQDAHWVSCFTAKTCLHLFVGRVVVKGQENLPPPSSSLLLSNNNHNEKQHTTTRSSLPAPIYIANHASQIDIAAVYFIERRFKWTAKHTVAYLPGVGQIMMMAQHVIVRRSKSSDSIRQKGQEELEQQQRRLVQQQQEQQQQEEEESNPSPSEAMQNNSDVTPLLLSKQSSSQQQQGSTTILRKPLSSRRSNSTLFEQASVSVSQQGIPVFFFPQGTRWMVDRLPFKDGAFIVAQDNEAPIIPISIDIPRNGWNSHHPLPSWMFGTRQQQRTTPTQQGSTPQYQVPPIVTLTVHPPIPVTKNSNLNEI